MRLLRLLLIIALLGLSPATMAATESDREAAQERVNQGLLHARAGEFAKAIPEFEAALKLYPNAEIMHSLARSHEELKRLPEAHEWFGKALETNPAYLYAADARERLTKIEERLRETHGLLKVETTPGNARVTLEMDERIWRHLTVPMSRWMPAGEVKVEASREGFKSSSGRFSVQAGAEKAVKLTLTPIQLKGYINVACSVAGAEVLVDGLSMGFTPLNTLTLTEGSHVVEVRAGGYASQTRTVQVVADATSPTVAFQLTLDEDTRVLTDGGKKTLSTVLFAAGGAATIGATIVLGLYYRDYFHAADLHALAEEQSLVEDPKDPSGLGQQMKNEANQYWEDNGAAKEPWWITGYATGGALIAAGAIVRFVLTEPGDAPERPDSASWSVWPSITHEGVGAGATLRF